MEKVKLFVDFDGTIANSNKAICDLYNKYYDKHSQFVKADYTKVMDWDFKDVCPLMQKDDMMEYFSSEELFSISEPNADAIEMLEELKNYFQVIIVTIGTQRNIHFKSMLIEDWLPDTETIYIYNGDNCHVDKSIINMDEGLLIDDNVNNLDTSNASIKIIFGKETNFNIGDYMRMENWKDLFVYLRIANQIMNDTDILSDEENEYRQKLRESISEVL